MSEPNELGLPTFETVILRDGFSSLDQKILSVETGTREIIIPGTCVRDGQLLRTKFRFVRQEERDVFTLLVLFKMDWSPLYRKKL